MAYGLADLLEAEGMTDMEFLEHFALESIVPGICRKCGCTYDYEPDNSRGWCDSCESNTVVSGLILLGIM